MLGLGIGFGLGSCSSQDDSNPIAGKNCPSLSSDQIASFMDSLKQNSAPIIADRNFTSDEQTAIQTAVNKWNQLGSSNLNLTFFKLSFGSIPEDARNADPRTCTSDTQTSNQFYIIKETSQTHWASLGFNDHTPGATLRCQGGNQLIKQVVMIDTPIIDPEQFLSVVLHELGHSTGLDHSCTDSQGVANFRWCGDLPETHPYRQAVMFPSLELRASPSDQPQIKENIQPNDSERVECLYQ
jgi:hypothetical protein